MKVKVLKGKNVLLEAFGLKTKSDILLEWWDGESKWIADIAKMSVSDFLKEKGKQFLTQERGTAYYSFLKYLTSFNESGKKEDVYTWVKDIGKHKITINFVVTTEPQKSNGKTKQDPENPVITVFLQKRNFISAITNTIRKSDAIKLIGDIILSTKQTISHELTHYFQIKNGTLGRNEVFDSNKEVSYRLKPFYFFCYFVENHELEAFMKSVYNLYIEKKKRRKTFFQCLIYQIAKRANMQHLGVAFLDEKISFKDVLMHLQPHIQFITEWLICCHIPLYNNFGDLLKKSIKSDNEILSNPNLLDENKKNLENFFRNLSSEQENKFDDLLQKQRQIPYYNLLFSTKISNKKAIQEITDNLD